MKKAVFITLALAVFCMSKTTAQAPDMSKAVKEKMTPLSSWIGRWKGEGTIQMGPGQSGKSSVDEQMEWKLDGTVILINGIGKDSKTGEIVHEALGVLTYDAFAKQYKFRSWLRTGLTTEAWFTMIDENKYQWGFDTGQGKIKHSITLDSAKKTWNEVGEFSADGNTWMKFFEMNLTKI